MGGRDEQGFGAVDRLGGSPAHRRGGNWACNASACTTAYRMCLSENERCAEVSFRLVRSLGG